jgi:hypothetical protein
MPATDTGTVAGTYVEAWTRGDFDTARSTLREDVSFVGPLGTANSIDECMRGLQGMKQMVDSAQQRAFEVTAAASGGYCLKSPEAAAIASPVLVR